VNIPVDAPAFDVRRSPSAHCYSTDGPLVSEPGLDGSFGGGNFAASLIDRIAARSDAIAAFRIRGTI
jgi:hypothetical protein